MLSFQANTSVLPPYPGFVSNPTGFPDRLAGLREQYSLTQAQLAERIGIHLLQLRSYEAGSSQPTLDAIRKIATALQVGADVLSFGEGERGPDGDIHMRFEAVSRFEEWERRVVRSLLEGMTLKQEARRWQAVSTGGERK